jgi:hypothetical protein
MFNVLLRAVKLGASRRKRRNFEYPAMDPPARRPHGAVSERGTQTKNHSDRKH